ncbi:MAG: PD40 domain-containing protein [Planctomycetaceae bacterium]|nr:PD40 domain-containing protein [Planctomycetaceae bacterium]
MKRRRSPPPSLCLVCAIAIILAVTSSVRADEPLTQEQVSQNVANVVERIRSFEPVEQVNDNQMDIYLLDLESGNIEVAFDDPNLELGTPFWSADGLKIMFDATPGRKWNQTQMMMLDATADDADVTVVGFGNCPTISPNGKQVSYRLNRDALPGTEPGVWVQDLNGEELLPLGIIGYPRWSPDGDKILVSGYGFSQLTLVDVATSEQVELKLDGLEFRSNPYWVDGSSTIIGLFVSQTDAKIALIEVSQPDRCRLERVLWTQGDGLNVSICSPVYSSFTGKCIFSGRTDNGYQLYILDDKQEGPPQAINHCGPVSYLDELAMSPDGRYILFCSSKEIRELLKKQPD